MLTDQEARRLLAEAANTIDVHEHAIAPRPRRARHLPIALSMAAVAVVAGVTLLGALDNDGGDATDQALTSPAVEQTSSPPVGRMKRFHNLIELSERKTTEGAGTARVPVGTRPQGATGIHFRIACLTPGRINFPKGGSISCNEEEAARFRGNPTELGGGAIAELERGESSILIGGEPGTRWRVVTSWVRVETPRSQSVDDSQLGKEQPLSECPTALAYFERPDVREFLMEHFGAVPSAEDYWDGSCPDVALLEQRIREAQERVEGRQAP